MSEKAVVIEEFKLLRDELLSVLKHRDYGNVLQGKSQSVKLYSIVLNRLVEDIDEMEKHIVSLTRVDIGDIDIEDIDQTEKSITSEEQA